MEAGEHVFKVDKGPLYNNTVLSYVTEFEKSLNCMKHLFGHISLNYRDIHPLRK
jgi:hypothetical protein